MLAAGRCAGLLVGSSKGPEDKHHRGDGQRRCLSTCCSSLSLLTLLITRRNTIFVPAPEANSSLTKIAPLWRFSSNSPTAAPLPWHILHRSLVSLYLLPHRFHVFCSISQDNVGCQRKWLRANHNICAAILQAGRIAVNDCFVEAYASRKPLTGL